tara:strand:+ start:84 stop:539 length:456 start_codon:yes stop_codon:yes gene_type:complete
MNFFRNLWKKNPKLIMYIGGMFILIGFINAVQEERTPPTASTPKTNEAKKENAPVKTYRLTAQEVVDKHEFKMRWACEDAIKAQLTDPRSYKAVKVRYGAHMMNEHPDAVVDTRISFDAKNSFGGNAPSFGRCAFDSYGNMVRSPNVIPGY